MFPIMKLLCVNPFLGLAGCGLADMTGLGHWEVSEGMLLLGHAVAAAGMLILVGRVGSSFIGQLPGASAGSGARPSPEWIRRRGGGV